ncbi:hypothetical protein [Kitasatospora sp. NPDC059160]|uniref:hypothetical protein n=1 Tax=Kitasatospora sp. NPDC059160 TaxID=3346748 RepID=UPI00369D498D
MIRRRPAVGSAVAPPPGMEPGASERALAPAMRPIRAAARRGRLAVAEQLAQELQHELAAARGAEHPEVLQAAEARAYLAHLAGRWAEASQLYQQAAAGWARADSPRCWPATLNAQACERLAADPVRPSAPGLADQVLQLGRTAAGAAVRRAAPAATNRAVRRGTLVLLVAATAVVAAAVGLVAESGAERTAGPAVELTASAVGQALQHAPVPTPTPTPTPMPMPVPVLTASPTAEPPTEQPDDQDPAEADAPPAARPSHRPRPARPVSPAGPPAPGQPPQQAPAAKPPRPADPCAAAREYGHLPDNVVALCQQAYAR